jgi:hypothetical protein
MVAIHAHYDGKVIVPDEPLNSTNHHQNILVWGMGYALQPAAGSLTNNYSLVWSQVYYQVDGFARKYSPKPGVLGLIGAFLTWGMAQNTMVARGSGYVFQWQLAQQSAYTMRQLLTGLYGTTKDPDIYVTQVYHANSYDAYNALYNMETGSVSGGLPIQSSKIFVDEFAASSAMGSTGSTGTNVPAYGDDQTPVTTQSGQSSWVEDTLCLMKNANIQELAYWAMYDPYTLWSTAPWSFAGQALSWNAFWGVAFESSTKKASWSVLEPYYLNGSLVACGTSGFQPANFTPILTLTPANTDFTISQPVRVTWTAAEAASLTLNDGYDGTYACDIGDLLAGLGNLVPASCAFTNATAFSTAGNRTITLSATSVGGALSDRVPELRGVPAPPLTASIVDTAGKVRLVPFQASSLPFYTFSLLVPATGQFTLAVGSRYLTLADEAGAPLSDNGYSTLLDTSAILAAWASTPPWIPL